MRRYLIYNSDADEAVPPQLIYTSPTSFLRRWETLFNQFSIKNKNVPNFGTLYLFISHPDKLAA